jgi:hypothetical protein
VSEQIENPFLAAETAAETLPVRAAAGAPSDRATPAKAGAGASRRRLVIDETPHPHPPRTRPGPVASIPGLERPRPLAARLRRLRTASSPARRVAIAGVGAAVLIAVVLAVTAVSGGGTDRRLLAARRAIAALSDANRRLQAQALSLSAVQRQLEDQLRAARSQLQTLEARLGAGQARQRGHGKGR